MSNSGFEDDRIDWGVYGRDDEQQASGERDTHQQPESYTGILEFRLLETGQQVDDLTAERDHLLGTQPPEQFYWYKPGPDGSVTVHSYFGGPTGRDEDGRPLYELNGPGSGLLQGGQNAPYVDPGYEFPTRNGSDHGNGVTETDRRFLNKRNLIIGGVVVAVAGVLLFISTRGGDSSNTEHSNTDDAKAAIGGAVAATPKETTAANPTSSAETQPAAPAAMDIKFKLPGCSIKSSVVHAKGILPSYLLEHLQQDDSQFAYDIPTHAEGDIPIMLCDTDPQAVTLDKTTSTAETAVFSYDVSKLGFLADLTQLDMWIDKEKPKDAYLNIKTNISDKAVRVDGRHVTQDRRTVAKALLKNMDVITRQHLSDAAVAGIITSQAGSAMQAYCEQLAVDQGFTAEAITCTPTGEFTPSATDFSKGHDLVSLEQYEHSDDPNRRAVYARAPFDKEEWATQIESVTTGAMQ